MVRNSQKAPDPESGIPISNPEEFARSLKQRGEAARGLEHDLLTQVPLTYGTPGEEHAEIVMGRLHREAMVARNGGGVLESPSRGRAEARLPFERLMEGLLVLLVLLYLLA